MPNSGASSLGAEGGNPAQEPFAVNSPLDVTSGGYISIDGAALVHAVDGERRSQGRTFPVRWAGGELGRLQQPGGKRNFRRLQVKRAMSIDSIPIAGRIRESMAHSMVALLIKKEPISRTWPKRASWNGMRPRKDFSGEARSQTPDSVGKSSRKLMLETNELTFRY